MLDPAYLVMIFMATVACPYILFWRDERERRRQRATIAALGSRFGTGA